MYQYLLLFSSCHVLRLKATLWVSWKTKITVCFHFCVLQTKLLYNHNNTWQVLISGNALSMVQFFKQTFSNFSVFQENTLYFNIIYEPSMVWKNYMYSHLQPPTSADVFHTCTFWKNCTCTFEKFVYQMPFGLVCACSVTSDFLPTHGL